MNAEPIPGVIVVLGFLNDDRGRLSGVARERCERAFREFEKNPGFAVLPTGGWGGHFNTTPRPHAHYLRAELTARGVPESAFLPGAESASTIEDAALSRPILAAHPGAELIVVTSDFHGERARFLFEREFPERKVTLSTCATHLPPDEIARRRAHEKRALERLAAERPGQEY